jgi:hypothetical protein
MVFFGEAPDGYVIFFLPSSVCCSRSGTGVVPLLPAFIHDLLVFG